MRLPVYLMIGQREGKAVQEVFPRAADANSAALDFCRPLWGADRGPLPPRWEDAMAALSRDGSQDWIAVVRRDLDYAAGLYAAQAEQMSKGVCDFAFAYCDATELASLIAEGGEVLSPLPKYHKALRAWMRLESVSLVDAMSEVIAASIPTVRALNGLLALDADLQRKAVSHGRDEKEQGDF